MNIMNIVKSLEELCLLIKEGLAKQLKMKGNNKMVDSLTCC